MADHVHMMIAIPTKYGCATWWATSRGKVRSTWLGCIGSERVILQSKASGRVGTLIRPWVETRQGSAITPKIRGKRTKGWNSSGCGDK